MKKIIYICIMFIALITVFSAHALAEPSITIGEVYAPPRGQAVVNINMANNPGFSTLMFNVVYDKDTLTFSGPADIALGDGFKDLRLTLLGSGDGQFGIYIMGDDAQPTKSSGDGVLATITFSAQGALNTQSDIILNTLYATTANNTPIPYTLTGGTVRVTNDPPLKAAAQLGEAAQPPPNMEYNEEIAGAEQTGGEPQPFVPAAGIIQLPNVAATGEVLQLTGRVYPDNVTNNQLVFSVIDDGNTGAAIFGDAFLANDSGLVLLRVTVPNGLETGDYAKDFYVVVSKPTGIITGIRLNKAALTLSQGHVDTTLKAEVFPNDAPGRDVTWSSSNPAVATIDAYGTLYGVNAGSATITAAAGNFSAQCIVEILPIPVVSVSLNAGAASIADSGSAATVQLKAEVFPQSASNQSVMWSSSDPSVAKVDSNGLVEGKSVGEAVVTVTTVDQQKIAICIVKVYGVDIQSVTISGAPRNNALFVGDTHQLGASVVPAYARDPGVSWSSSDTAVATIDQNGVVRAVSSGSSLIRATSTQSPGVFADLTIITQLAPTLDPLLPPTEVPKPTAISLPTAVAPSQPDPLALGVLNAEATREASKADAKDGQITAKVVGLNGRKYVYSLDTIKWTGATQNAVTFKNLPPGLYTVFAREQGKNDITLTKNVLLGAVALELAPSKDAVFTVPRGLNVILKEANQALIAWEIAAGATGYEIYRTSDGKNFEIVGTTTNLWFIDVISGSKKKFGYKIRALGEGGSLGEFTPVRTVVNAAEAALSPTPKPTATAKSIERPETPSGVKAIGGKGGVKITWGVVRGADGYEIAYATAANGKYTQLAVIGGSGVRQYIHDGLKVGTTYYYKVRAYVDDDKRLFSVLSDAVTGTAK